MAQHEIYWETVRKVLHQEGMEPHPGPYNGLRVIDILERRIAGGWISDPADYLRLSTVYYEKGDIANAIERAKTYTELVPDDPLGYNEVGKIYTFNGFLEEGRVNLTKAMTLAPQDPYIRFNMATNCLMSRDREGALENLVFFLQLPEDPNNQDYYILKKVAQLDLYRIVTNTPAFTSQPDGWYREITVDPEDLERVLHSYGLTG